MAFLEIAGEAAGELVLVSYDNVSDAFQNVLDEFGGFRPPADWVDTPEENLRYILNELRPDAADLQNDLITLKGKLDEVGVDTSALEEEIDNLGLFLGLCQDMKDNPEAFYGLLERSGGARTMFNEYGVQERRIAGILTELQREYQSTRVASL